MHVKGTKLQMSVKMRSRGRGRGNQRKEVFLDFLLVLFVYHTPSGDTKYLLDWYRGIPVYNICLISISNSVSDDLQTNQFSILKGHSTSNSASEYEPDVLNTFCATQV